MDNRLRILKDVAQMFSHYGIRSVSMDKISTDLGISKRTLYELFTDKDELVRQVLEEGLKAHKNLFIKEIESSENVIESIFRIGRLNVEIFNKINPLFFEDLKKFHFKVYNSFQCKGGFEDMQLARSLFEKGIQQGVFLPNLNIDLVNSFLHKVIEILHEDDFKRFGSEALSESIMLPYFNGIATSAGKELISKYIGIFNFYK